MAAGPKRPDLVERDAKERWQLMLGLTSLVLWFGVSFGLVIAGNLLVGPIRPAGIILAGALAALVAAAPWLAYQRLVRRDITRGT